MARFFNLSSTNMTILLSCILLITLLFSTQISTTAAARPLDALTPSLPPLAARLKLDDSSTAGEPSSASSSTTSCWESLYKLQSCAGEVIQFFYNGETSLGHSCCEAISFIEHSCWPAMLSTLGYTPEESEILRGYCDAEKVLTQHS